jgi:tetratricopeptide (TPR) repeat protein
LSSATDVTPGTSAAQRSVERVPADNGEPDKAELTLARTRLQNNDAAGAEEAALRVLARQPELDEALLIVAWARLQQNDAAGAEAAARRILARRPQLEEAELILARARLKENDAAAAEQAALRVLARKPQHDEAELILARARRQKNDARGAEEAARRVLARRPGLDEAELIVAWARLQQNDAAGAEAAALRILARRPEFAPAAMIAVEAARWQGDVEKAVAHYRRLAAIAPEDVRWPLRIVDVLNLGGRVSESRRELESIVARWPAHRLVAHYLEHGAVGGLAPGPEPEAASPHEAELARPIVVDRPDADVLVAECRGAEIAVVVFTGMGDRIAVPVVRFDRYLAALGVAAVYLKDFRRILFVKGVQSLGTDYGDTVDGLRDITRRLGAKRVCTIGSSGGGRAAIRYGIDLGASNIVSIGGATGPAPCLRGAPLITRRTLAHTGPETLDLKPFLQARQYAAKIALVYATDAAEEAAAARHLSGLPGVSLHPVPGPPPAMFSLVKQDDFMGMLARLLGIGPAWANRSA